MKLIVPFALTKPFITRERKNKCHFVRHNGKELDFPTLLLSSTIAMKTTNWLENKFQLHNCVKCENQERNEHM